MNKDILYVVKSLSNEKGVSEDVIFEAIELALASVAARRYDDEVNIRVSIDHETGEYETYRCWDVVASDDDIEFPGYQITLADAREEYGEESLDVGVTMEEMIESEAFGRISAMQAKQVIIQKVREAERKKIIGQYCDRIGELLIGTVKRVTREFLVVDLGANAEGFLAREDLIPREAFRIGDRIRVVLTGVREEKRGPQLSVSRTAKELLIELFKIEVPEIGEEVIEIKAAARDPGLRAKIAVKTNDGRIDPQGACIGMRGSRVQAVSNELNGERVDIVLWDDSPAQLVINAMAPAEVVSIVVDEDGHSMDIAVAESQLSQAIGKVGQNIRLASALTGWKLNVMSEAEAISKHESESQRVRENFIEKLDVTEDIALLLVNEGFTSIESIAYGDLAELASIEGLDSEIASELQGRANDYLFIAELAGDDVEPSEDLLSLDGVTEEMAKALAEKEVATRDDLAELSINELQEIVELDDEAAGQLIMRAREHWFTGDE